MSCNFKVNKIDRNMPHRRSDNWFILLSAMSPEVRSNQNIIFAKSIVGRFDLLPARPAQKKEENTTVVIIADVQIVLFKCQY